MERVQLFAGRALAPGDPSDGNSRPVTCDIDGVLWSRLSVNGVNVTGFPNNTDAVSPVSTASNIPVVNYNYGYDAANSLWRRQTVRRLDNLASFSAGSTEWAQLGLAVLAGFDSNVYRRLNTASQNNIGAASSDGALLATLPGEWAIFHQPAVATRATISRAAVAGVRHVCKGFSAVLNCVAAVTVPLVINVRDGATGAGTILYTERITGLAGTTVRVERSGLNLVGTANTAMTVEFAAAPAAGDFQCVNLNGYDTPS
jgi:hypothetical protein